MAPPAKRPKTQPQSSKAVEKSPKKGAFEKKLEKIEADENKYSQTSGSQRHQQNKILDGKDDVEVIKEEVNQQPKKGVKSVGAKTQQPQSSHQFVSNRLVFNKKEITNDSRQPNAEERWPRPPLPIGMEALQPQVDLHFQLLDLDYFFEENEGIVVRLFGVTLEGNSIAVNVHNYKPYFFAAMPEGFGTEHIDRGIALLNDAIKGSVHASMIPPNTRRLVTDMEIVVGTPLYCFTPKDRVIHFLKIFVVSPRLFTSCKRSLDLLSRMVNAEEARPVQAFEANLDFEVRFMSDLKLVGCGWAECLGGTYQNVKPNLKRTSCQIEIDVDVNNLGALSSSSPEWSGIAPLRILSFDIECLGRRGVFPEASHDPIVQIANMVKVEGQTEPFIRNCFVLGDCTAVVGSDVIICLDEADLLTKWASFVKMVDPDFLTGYNIQNFDLPYILDRAKQLKVENKVAYISRVPTAMCKQRDSSIMSKQIGARVNRQTQMDGRIIFDVLQLVLRDYKLRSYTLNSVSFHFLGEQKEDVAPNVIPDLHNGEPRDRRRLAVYCMKDAYLPLRLLDKLMLVINYIEMARVTGVPLDFLVSRGQQVKILSMLLRRTRELNIFMPVIEQEGGAGDDAGYEGATVLDPLCAFYNEPIATLDFASLYPSIMIAHNLCYTTLIKRPHPGMVEGQDYIRTPSGDLFVTRKQRLGLLPKILEDLLAARKRVKGEMKTEKDPFRLMVLNGRQLAIKISANSVYGFTGAQRGKLPCTEISQSVTAFGRQMIELTKNAVESTYKEGFLNLCPKDSQVVYGDTDSVMVRFGVKTVAEAMVLGKHAAENISQQFLPPIKLEFEKVYYPYLLINKKRYAGLYWTNPERHDKMDCKGLETVRRDNCPLVASVLSTCLKKLLIDRNADNALAHAKQVITDLLCGRVDMSMLIVTKELTKSGEKYAAKQAHVELAERMRKRDPGSAPRLGDRVPYVIINKGKNVPLYDKAEDPIFVLQNSLPIDTEYYLEHQLVKPLARIFEPILGDNAEKLLLTGEHTKKKVAAKAKNVGGLFGFTVKTARCLGCKGVLPGYEEEDTAPAVCDHCKQSIGMIYADKMMTEKMLEHRFARLWTECQNCAGQILDEVMCNARDCPIFYMREKVREDLFRHRCLLKRFQIGADNDDDRKSQTDEDQ